MKTLLLEAQMKKAARVKDGSVTLTFQTNKEIDTQDWTLMDEYWKQNGWLAFKIDEIEEEDIPESNTKIEGQKSQSLQLRNALFAKHMHSGGTKESFTPYYNKVMDRFIQSVTDSF